MQIVSKIIELLTPFGFNPLSIKKDGPNTLAELLSQFDTPKKDKTNDDVIRDYLIKEAMARLEVDMLKMEETKFFKGQQKCYDNNGMFYDWVYCSVRPEVMYCSYGKN